MVRVPTDGMAKNRADGMMRDPTDGLMKDLNGPVATTRRTRTPELAVRGERSCVGRPTPPPKGLANARQAAHRSRGGLGPPENLPREVLGRGCSTGPEGLRVPGANCVSFWRKHKTERGSSLQASCRKKCQSPRTTSRG